MRHRIALALALLVLPGAPLAAQTTGVWSTAPRTEQVDPNKMDEPDMVSTPGPIERMLVGTWDLWVPGGFWYSSDGTRIFQHYTAGAAMNRLTIEADGSYRWGSHKGRLVEIRPWFAQPGDRYYAVAMNESVKYMARWNKQEDKLSLFFWGVGGHAATGTRVGKAPTPAPEPAATKTDPGRTTAAAATTSSTNARTFTGTAVNSGVTGTAVLTMTPLGRDSVRLTASFSGRLGGNATLLGTLRGENLNANGELTHQGTRYTMVVTGRVTKGGELTATYTLTARDGRGTKQGGTLSARAEAATPSAGQTVGAGAQSNANATPTTPSNPLGVEWVGENSSSNTSPQPASDDPNCAPNPLGVVWAQCKQKAPSTATATKAGANSLTGTWHYTSLRVTHPNGEVQDYGNQVKGTFILRNDGTFQQEILIGTARTARSGNYRIEGEVIRLLGPNGATVMVRYGRNGQQLWLEEEQRGTRLRFGLVQH